MAITVFFALVGVRWASAQEAAGRPQTSTYWDDYKVWGILHKGTSVLGKDEVKADMLLHRLIDNAHLVKFKPVNGANPRNASEFLKVYQKSASPRSEMQHLGCGFFRTKDMGDYLVGSFLTDEPERMRADIEKNPSLELLSVEKVTPEMFIEYEATRQESLAAAPASGKSIQDGAMAQSSQFTTSWVDDCNIWMTLRKETSILGKDAEKEERLLQRLSNNVYVVKFKPVNGANPKNASEFINVYHKSSSLRSGGVNLGYGAFVTKNMGDYLVGSFLTDEPEQMKEDIKKNPSLALLSVEKVTPEMFVEYAYLPQESLTSSPADSKSAQEARSLSGNSWVNDCRIWTALRKGTSILGKDAEKEERLLQRLINNVYVVKFKPVNGANPRNASEFINVYHKSSSLQSGGVNLGYGAFVTKNMGDHLVGSFLTDEPEQMQADIKKNPSLELLSVEKVTPEMFVEYVSLPQESLAPVPGCGNSTQAADRPQASTYWDDYKVWEILRSGKSVLGKDEESADKLLQRLINNVHVVKFKPVNDANPKNASEFLKVYQKSSSLRSGGVNLGYGAFVTYNMGDHLVGSFLTDEPERMREDIKKNPSLELLSVEKVTPEMFVEYVRLPQESLASAPGYSKWRETWGKWLLLSKNGDQKEIDEFLQKNLVDVCLVKFKPVNGANPKTAKEYLSLFYKSSSSKTELDNLLKRTGFFRTKIVDGYLVGSFLTEAPDEMKAYIKNNSSLELLSVEKVTPEMFLAYDATRQESLGSAQSQEGNPK